MSLSPRPASADGSARAILTRGLRRDPACPLPLLARCFAGGGLQQAVFIAGNFTAQGLHGLNKTWPDLDMIPMGPEWWAAGAPQEQLDRGQTIATLWTIGRYPLSSAGALPLDDVSLGYLTNPKALALINIGEDLAATATGFAALGLPATNANVYRVEDLWTGEVLGDHFGDEEIQVALRPHASALLVVTRLA